MRYKRINPRKINMDLRNVWEFDTVLYAVGLKVNDEGIPSCVPDPREAVKYSKSYFMKYYYTDSTDTTEISLRNDALEEIEELERSIKKEKNPKYRDYKIKFRGTVKNGGKRLFDREKEYEWKIEVIERDNQSIKGYASNMLSQAGSRGGPALVAYEVANFIGLPIYAKLGIAAFTLYITEPLADKISNLREKNAYRKKVKEKGKVNIQTTIEAAKECKVCISGSVDEINPMSKEEIDKYIKSFSRKKIGKKSIFKKKKS